MSNAFEAVRRENRDATEVAERAEAAAYEAIADAVAMGTGDMRGAVLQREAARWADALLCRSEAYAVRGRDHHEAALKEAAARVATLAQRLENHAEAEWAEVTPERTRAQAQALVDAAREHAARARTSADRTPAGPASCVVRHMALYAEAAHNAAGEEAKVADPVHTVKAVAEAAAEAEAWAEGARAVAAMLRAEAEAEAEA